MTREEEKGELMAPIEQKAHTAAGGDAEKGTEQPPQQRTTQPPEGSKHTPAEGPKKKREKNQDFQDLEKTGRWGSISRKEMIILALVVLAVIGGVVAAVVIVTGNNKERADRALPPRPTPAPTLPPAVDPTLQLPVILAAVGSNPFVNSSLAMLPADVSFYRGKAADVTQAPLVRAMAWSLYEDERDPPPTSDWLVPRFALAAFYYGLSGEQWTNQDGWLTFADPCEWEGVFCDRFGNLVHELFLNKNNLAGTVPAELSMLTDIISLSLSDNKLTGTVPFEALGSLPSLSFLFLNDNKLNGTISASVRNNGVLSTLMLQENDFTGEWPRTAFCNETVRDVPLLTKYGLDCKEVNFACSCCSEAVINRGQVCY